MTKCKGASTNIEQRQIKWLKIYRGGQSYWEDSTMAKYLVFLPVSSTPLSTRLSNPVTKKKIPKSLLQYNSKFILNYYDNLIPKRGCEPTYKMIKNVNILTNTYNGYFKYFMANTNQGWYDIIW